MRVSVILPVYRVSAYIERCIRSVLAQSCRDYELLVIDDATDDDSIVQAEHVLREHSGELSWQILKHAANRGLSAARNTGIRAAKGDYLYFMDSDDVLTPDCLEQLLSLAEADPSVEAVQGNALIIRPHRKDCLLIVDPPAALNSNQAIRADYFSKWSHIPFSVWNLLIRRDFVVNNGLFFEEGIIYEDVIWKFQLMKVLSRIRITPRVTYLYYKHPGSISISAPARKEVDSQCRICSEMMAHLTPGSESQELSHYMERFCRTYMRLARQNPALREQMALFQEQADRHHCRFARAQLRFARQVGETGMGNLVLFGMRMVKRLSRPIRLLRARRQMRED